MSDQTEPSSWSRRGYLKSTLITGTIGLSGFAGQGQAGDGSTTQSEKLPVGLSPKAETLLKKLVALRGEIPWESNDPDEILEERLESNLQRTVTQAKRCRWDQDLFSTAAARDAFRYFTRATPGEASPTGVTDYWKPRLDDYGEVPLRPEVDRHIPRALALDQVAAELSGRLSRLEIPDIAKITDSNDLVAAVVPRVAGNLETGLCYRSIMQILLLGENRMNRIQTQYDSQADMRIDTLGRRHLSLIVNTPRIALDSATRSQRPDQQPVSGVTTRNLYKHYWRSIDPEIADEPLDGNPFSIPVA